MAPYSSILAEKILWTEEPGGPQSMGHRETTEWLNMHACLQTVKKKKKKKNVAKQ